jgi:hypothetical protein
VSTLTRRPTPDARLEDVLAHADHLDWLVRPIPRGGTWPDCDAGLVFNKFQSMSQTWRRSGT